MRMEMRWDDAARRLTLRLAPGSRMLRPTGIAVEARVAGSDHMSTAIFKGDPVLIAL